MTVQNLFLEARIQIGLSGSLPVLSVDDAIQDLLGFGPDAFLKGEVSLRNLIHTGDHDIASELFAGTAHPSSGEVSIRIRQANGRIRCVRVQFDKVLNDSGTAIALDLLLQDAKSLSRNLSIKPMMANFKAMMENTDDFIFFKDRNHVFTGASQTLVAITDPSEHWTDLIGQTDYDVFPENYADVYYELEKQVFAGIPIAHEIQKTLTKDGKKGWVDNRKYPIRNDEGEIVGLFGIARDITEKKRVEAELQREQQFSKSVIDNLPGIFYLYTYPDCRLILWNKQHESIFGYDSTEMAGRHVADWHLPEARNAVLQAVEHVMTVGQNVIEAPLVAKDGRLIYFALSGIKFESQNQAYFMGIGTDISERRKTEEALKRSEERHRLLADNATDVIWTMNLEGHFTYISPSVEKLRGYTSAELIDQSLEDAVMPGSLQTVRDGLNRLFAAIRTGQPIPDFRGEVEQPCKDGSTVWTEATITTMRNSMGEYVGLLGVTRDITRRKKMEEQVRQLAFHDPLTNLPNRRLLNDRLSQAMASGKRTGCHGALMFLDLDHFKTLNDTLGHKVGDMLLVQTASRLNSCVREIDTVARFGGDEFVVMISELVADEAESTVKAMLIAEKIRVALSEPYWLSIKHDNGTETKIEHRCTSSIGLTLFMGQESTQDEILKFADAAMYQAKEAGRNQIRLASSSPPG